MNLFASFGSVVTAGAMTVALSVSTSVLVVSEAHAQSAPSQAGCRALTKMREVNREANSAIAGARTKKTLEDMPDFDAEEAGCISSYGANLGFGMVSSLAGNLLNSLKDAACSALDDYIDESITQFGSSISAPMDLGEIDLGLGRQDSLLKADGEGRAFGFDFDKIMDDVADELPSIEGQEINVDGDMYTDRVPGSEYTNQSRGSSIPSPDFNPDARR